VPLLPNDKANVRALPKPSYTKSLGADLMRRYDTDCERQLATIWEDVLGTEKFGPEDNFFDVGGHSLLMSKLGLLIEQRLQIAITNLDLFQFPTIRSLARHVTESRRPTAPAHALANRRIAADMARRAALARRRTKPAGAIDGVGPDRVM
jgi:acyl carrier protein